MVVRRHEAGATIGCRQGLLQEVQGIHRVIPCTVDQCVLDIIVRDHGDGDQIVDIGQRHAHHNQQEQGQDHVEDGKYQNLPQHDRRHGIRGEYDNQHQYHQQRLYYGCEGYAPHLAHGRMTDHAGVALGENKSNQGHRCSYRSSEKIVLYGE